MSKDCNYAAVNAKIHQTEAVRDAFILGLLSSSIRLKLLENIQDEAVTLDAKFNQARSLERALKMWRCTAAVAIYLIKASLTTGFWYLPEVTAHSVDQDESKRCAATEHLQKSYNRTVHSVGLVNSTQELSVQLGAVNALNVVVLFWYF